MTNHNSAANAIRSVRKKIDTYGSPDGVPPTTKAAPKRGRASKASKNDDTNAKDDNADSKASTKKKTATQKKADVGNGDGVGGANDGTAAATAEDSSATSTSPKRKNGAQEDGSPKKKIRETKIKSESIVKEEEGLSEGKATCT